MNIYLSLGSNIGNRIEYLKKAVELLEQNPDISMDKSSSFYETDPQGWTDQEPFINIVISIETRLEPLSLLKFCQSIEVELKRKRLFRWGPRTIDIDILIYDDIIMNCDELIIPHPRMFERAFVLVPLAEIDEDYKKYLLDVKDQIVRKVNV